MALNNFIIRKGGRTYETKIMDYMISEGKIKLQVINAEPRSIFLYQRDKIDVGIPQKGGFCHFESTILYRDVIDHYVIIDYPQNIVKEERRKFKRLSLHLNISVGYDHQHNMSNNLSKENRKEKNPELIEKEKSHTDIISDPNNFDQVMMSNISMGGLAFYSIEGFKSGETVFFNFSLPNNVAFQNLQGEIKYSKPTKYKKVNEYGVKFIDITSVNQKSLKNFIFTYISSHPSTAED
jgi:c-di-GMP-binding flagellar brake protein YcgR